MKWPRPRFWVWRSRRRSPEHRPGAWGAAARHWGSLSASYARSSTQTPSLWLSTAAPASYASSTAALSATRSSAALRTSPPIAAGTNPVPQRQTLPQSLQPTGSHLLPQPPQTLGPVHLSWRRGRRTAGQSKRWISTCRRGTAPGRSSTRTAPHTRASRCCPTPSHSCLRSPILRGCWGAGCPGREAPVVSGDPRSSCAHIATKSSVAKPICASTWALTRQAPLVPRALAPNTVPHSPSLARCAGRTSLPQTSGTSTVCGTRSARSCSCLLWLGHPPKRQAQAGHPTGVLSKFSRASTVRPLFLAPRGWPGT